MDESRCYDVLTTIARLANEAVHEPRHPAGQGAPSTASAPPGQDLGCLIKALPDRLQLRAAKTATRINPVNAPLTATLADGVPGVMSPQHIAVLTSKYWGPQERELSVSFMEPTESELRARIMTHLNAWADTCGVSFTETAGTGEVRISRGPGGYYSYLGTDILLIPPSQQTMNLQGFTMETPESEYRRVVRHEAGHTLGFPHEHMRRELVRRIDPAKAYPYFLARQGWTKEVVDQQVLTPLDEESLFNTPADQDSIMCYQLPGSITFDSQPIRGGSDINATDAGFAGEIYPRVSSLPPSVPAQRMAQGQWPEADDVLTAG